MEINTTIKEFITTELLAGQNQNALADTDPLIDSGIIDSLGIMALMGFLEDRYAIQIGSDELLPENFESILKISTLVSQKTGLSAGA